VSAIFITPVAGVEKLVIDVQVFVLNGKLVPAQSEHGRRGDVEMVSSIAPSDRLVMLVMMVLTGGARAVASEANSRAPIRLVILESYADVSLCSVDWEREVDVFIVPEMSRK
jgi:hypothetical protein